MQVPYFSGTATLLNQVRDLQGTQHYQELEQALDTVQPAVEALDDRLELSFASMPYDDENEMYVEMAEDPSRAQGYQRGDTMDVAHIRLKRDQSGVDGQAADAMGFGFVPSESDLATWIFRKPGQSAAGFVRDALTRAFSFVQDCQGL